MEMDRLRARQLADAGHECQRRGACQEAADLFSEAMEVFGGEGLCELRVDLMRWLGNAAYNLGDAAAAHDWFKKSQAAAAEISYTAGQAHVLNCFAAVAQRKGCSDEAEALYSEAAPLAIRAGDKQLEGMIEYNRGVLANIQGKLDAALAHYRLAQRIFEGIGDDWQLGNVLNNLAKLYTHQRQFTHAENSFHRALVLARGRRDLLTEGVLHQNRAVMLIAREKWDEAEAACQRSLELADERIDPLRRAEALRTLAEIHQHRLNLSAAEEVLQEAQKLASAAEDSLLIAQVLREVGRVCAQRGETEKAKVVWTDALRGFHAVGALPDVHDVQARLASLAA